MCSLSSTFVFSCLLSPTAVSFRATTTELLYEKQITYVGDRLLLHDKEITATLQSGSLKGQHQFRGAVTGSPGPAHRTPE